MQGKVVVITGATSGIGQFAAEALAGMGARIVQIARNRERGAAALERLNRVNPAVDHTVHYGDLSRVSEMKRIASEILSAEPRIDVLINNAGAMFNTHHLTEDGYERTFALNHLSYFVMTTALLDRMRSSAPARIVNTASRAHMMASSVDLKNLHSPKAYETNWAETLRYGGPAFKVYARSKLCNILFTRELARQLAGTGVIANSFHPGFVRTRFGNEAGGFIGAAIRFWKVFARPVQKGAETLVYLASSPDSSCFTGEYFFDCEPKKPSAAAQDDEAAKMLWQESERLGAFYGLRGPSGDGSWPGSGSSLSLNV